MTARSARRVLGLAAALLMAANTTLTTNPAFAQATAGAAQIFVGREDPGNKLVIRGTENKNWIDVFLKNDYLNVTVRVHPGESVAIGPRCRQGTTTTVNAIKVECGKAGPSVNVDFDLGGGNDILRFFDIAPRGTVKGGAGDDVLDMGGAKDSLGRAVYNSVHYQGGDGFDMINYSAFDSPVNITRGSGVQDDGRKGVDRDDIAADVEKLKGSKGNDTIYGSSEPDVILGYGGRDEIYGGGGDDVIYVDLRSEPASGPDIVSCGDGVDSGNYRDADTVYADCENLRRLG